MLYHWRKLHESTASAGAAKPWAIDAGRLALEDYVVRQGGGAEVLPGPGAGLFRIKRQVREQPLVSIVIPTAGRMRDVRGTPVDLLAQAITSLTAKTTWPHYELVIVADAAGIQETSRRALAGVRHRIIESPAQGAFNFSRKVNHGVSVSTGTHVVLFNDDLEVIEPEWLTAMLEYSQDPAIGARRREAAVSRRAAATCRDDPGRQRHRRACVPSEPWHDPGLHGVHTRAAQLFRRHRSVPDDPADGVRRSRWVRRGLPD